MLDEHSGEAFHRAEWGTVNHDRTLLGVVFSGIFEFETVRQLVVNLDGAKLPTASDGILYHTVEFRTIEGCLACLGTGIESTLSASVDDSLLSRLPLLVSTDVLLLVVRVAKGNLELYLLILETKDREHSLDDVEHAEELRLHLILTTEDVGIILSKGTHTRETVEFARLLVAIYGAKLSTAEWQLTIRAWLRSEYLTVVRTVHWFEHILLILLRGVDRLEGVLAIVSPVA